MNTQLAKLKKVAIFLSAISTASIPAMAHADWSIKGLGFLGAKEFYQYSYASGINDSGQVVGYSGTRGEASNHAFITGLNGIGMTDLGILGGEGQSHANGINGSGQVVGESDTAGGSHHAFITGPNGIGMTDLSIVGGAVVYSEAFGINDSGQVVGVTLGRGFHGFITGPNGIGMTGLGDSVPRAINDSGQVVGRYFPEGLTHAFITGPNGIGMTDLGTLGGPLSDAYDINASGQVVGGAEIHRDNPAIGYTHAFITGPNGIGMTDLGTLGGYYSHANGINDSGEVVGVATTATGEYQSHSFIFSHGGITDLSLLAPVVAAEWTNIVVTSINNNGQMVGYGYNGEYEEAFLLSYTPDTLFTPRPIYIPPLNPPPPPIPEPETYLMLLGGLGLIGYLARRRKETAI